MWFIGVEVEQETSAPPPKINPGSAPASTDKWGPFHKTSLEHSILLHLNCCKHVKCSVFLNHNKLLNQKVFMSLSTMRLWQNRSSRCSLPTGIEEESGKVESLFSFLFIVFLSFIAICYLCAIPYKKT